MIGARELVAAAAALALQETAPTRADAESRIEVQPVVDIRKHMHEAQREAMACDADAFDVLGGRQGGKTFFDVGWQLEGGWEVPGSTNPYFGLTGESVADIAWPEVVRWWQLLGWPVENLHASTRTAVLPNGSLWKGRGTDDRRYIETKRGAKYNRIAIDEMGPQPDEFIRYFVHDLLWPTMIKNRGRMVRSGNPGLVLKGYWYDRTGPARRVGSPLFRWTAWQNPSLGTPEDVDAFVSSLLVDAWGLTLEQVRQAIAEGATDGPAITFQREWLALWMADAGALVYPFDLERNGVDALPEANERGKLIDTDAWRYIIVGDPAGVGTTGIAVSAAHPELRRRFVVRSEKYVGMLMRQLAARFRELVALYPRAQLMLDSGGLGSVHAQEFHEVYALPTMAADKTEKPSAIRIFRDELIAGTIGVVNGPANDPIREEWSALGWDSKRLQHHPDHPDHCSDCALYGQRELRGWVQQEVAPMPPRGSREAIEAAEEAAIERRIKQLQRVERSTPSWR